jgi:uncharacterized protein YybS (DUF2232 family)
MNSKLKDSLLVYLCCLVGSFLIGSIFGLLSTLVFGLSGLILGIGYLKKWSYWQRILNASLVYLIGMPLMSFVLFGQIGMGDILLEGFQQSFNEIQSFLPEESKTFITSLIDTLNLIVSQGMPALLLLSGLGFNLVSDWLAKVVMKRLRLDYPKTESILKMQLGGTLAAVYTASFILMLLSILPASLQLIGLNIYLLFNMLFSVQGIIVIIAYFKGRQRPKLAIPFLIISFLTGVNAFFSILGVFDAFFNIRKRMNKDHEV